MALALGLFLHPRSGFFNPANLGGTSFLFGGGRGHLRGKGKFSKSRTHW